MNIPSIHFPNIVLYFGITLYHVQFSTPLLNMSRPASINLYMEEYFNVFMSPWNHWNDSVPTPPSFDVFVTLYETKLAEIEKKCDPRCTFASFNMEHRSAVADLVTLFSDFDDLSTFLEFALFVKSHPGIHPHVWHSAFLRAQLLGPYPNTLKIPRPSSIYLFPSEYFPDVTLRAAAAGIGGGSDDGYGDGYRGGASSFDKHACVTLDETVGLDNGAENALWYFREDIQLNAHHFIWHLLYPTQSRQQIPERGELFAFFHHDILARYATERLANGLTPSTPQALFIARNGFLGEGYNPHLTDAISSLPWAPRQPNTRLNGNTLTTGSITQLQTLEINRQNVFNVMTTGSVNVAKEGFLVYNETGLVEIESHISGRIYSIPPNYDIINILGELYQSSVFSINPEYYGLPGVHDMAHWLIGNIRGNYPSTTLGVMAFLATSMRDVIFYRHHQGIDNYFMQYKTNFLPPYQLETGVDQLVLHGIKIVSLVVQSTTTGASPNKLGTFWNTRSFVLQGGLDFNSGNINGAPAVQLCAKHLDHEEFTYTIQVQSSLSQATNVYVRIFMAPRYKTLSAQTGYSFEEQRHLFFAMDSFVQNVNPGTNIITRYSNASTLTVPWPPSIPNLINTIQNGAGSGDLVHCECGFPHHLLLPKGTEQGMTFDLFVLLSDVDTVNSTTSTESPFGQCIPSHIHCGILGENYPDSKPLGYPFDRTSSIPVKTSDASGNPVVQKLSPPDLTSYVNALPNAATVQVVITHHNIQVGTEKQPSFDAHSPQSVPYNM